MAQAIQRLGSSSRWSDVVIYRGVAKWVEVAENPQADAQGQVEQVLAQVDATLTTIGSTRADLLQVLVYLASLEDGPTLNEVWDGWVPRGDAPIRACVQAGLAPPYRIELVIEAACPSSS